MNLHPKSSEKSQINFGICLCAKELVSITISAELLGSMLDGGLNWGEQLVTLNASYIPKGISIMS